MTMIGDVKLERALQELSGRVEGAARAILSREDFSAEHFLNMTQGDPLLRERMRLAMLTTLVDQAMNEMEPGTDLRPVVGKMAALLGVEVEEWEN